MTDMAFFFFFFDLHNIVEEALMRMEYLREEQMGKWTEAILHAFAAF